MSSRFLAVAVAVAGIGLGLLAFGSLGSAAGTDCTDAQPCATTAAIATVTPPPPSGPPPAGMPVLDIEGDSNDDGADAWSWPSETPVREPERKNPMPAPAASPPAAPSATGTVYHAWLPNVARDGTPKPLPTPTATPTPTPTPTPTGPAIYLTFDDGPHPDWTPQVLAMLAKYGVRATFFELGVNVDAYPWLSADIVKAGHKIGDHTYSHPDLTRLGWSAINDQVGWTQAAILNATGKTTACFRPPYGSINSTVRNVLAGYGLGAWLWNIDPRDWARPGSAAIVNNVLTNARADAIILMHDGGGNRSQSVQALDTIIPTLLDRGYHFETLPCW